MDIVDAAQAAEDAQLRAAVSRTTYPRLAATGACHNCGAPVDPDERWCDGDCRDDWEARQCRA